MRGRKRLQIDLCGAYELSLGPAFGLGSGGGRNGALRKEDDTR
jgi:hypothetical protein